MNVGKVQEPEKELRFTRSGQAPAFWILAAMTAAAAVVIAAVSPYRGENPDLPHLAWALLPLLAAAVCARLAVRLTRHAYLILTPLGIEIFPFFRPVKAMSLILWHEIDSAEVDDGLTRLTLHYDAGRTAGLHLTLRPVRVDRRELLGRAVLGRLRERDAEDPPKLQGAVAEMTGQSKLD